MSALSVRLASPSPTAPRRSYRDLSPTADASEAAASVFEALRWAEGQAGAGARCVLLPSLRFAGGSDDQGGMAEHEPAVADRLYRAASGREAVLSADGDRLDVVPVQ